jgi:hypothetical protein
MIDHLDIVRLEEFEHSYLVYLLLPDGSTEFITVSLDVYAKLGVKQ